MSVALAEHSSLERWLLEAWIAGAIRYHACDHDGGRGRLMSNDQPEVLTELREWDEVPSSDRPLAELADQPVDTPWPTESWPVGDAVHGVSDLVASLFEDAARYQTTYAAVVIHRGRLVAERYDNALPSFTDAPTPVEVDTPLLSWSMAKSVLQAAIGVLVGRGELDLRAPAQVREWAGVGDPRAAITLDDLLKMRDGLAFREDYVDDQQSEVIEMLFGSGASDVAAFAASRPLAQPPGTTFNYSSGTSNIVARILGDALGGDTPEERTARTAAFLDEALFAPTGMTSATPGFDDAGTFVASSYLHATARDFARFGLLYLRDGMWDGTRVLPEGCVDHARRPASVDPEDGRLYGAHWWVTGDEAGSFWANGYDGQFILCVPEHDVVAVRLGKTDKALKYQLRAWHAQLVAVFDEHARSSTIAEAP